jgi:hypothetical protein
MAGREGLPRDPGNQPDQQYRLELGMADEALSEQIGRAGGDAQIGAAADSGWRQLNSKRRAKRWGQLANGV